MSKESLQVQFEALKIENEKLKQQLNSTRLEKAVLAFSYLPDEERNAVRLCYDFIWENYSPSLVREEFVWWYMDNKWKAEYKSLWVY